MHPSASPRHPWKAVSVVIAMLAVVHGAFPNNAWHDPAFRHHHAAYSYDDHSDCPDINVHIRDDGSDDDPVIDLFDGDDWS